MEEMSPPPFVKPTTGFDYPITFVKSERQGDIHLFIPESFDWNLVQDISKNFSRKIQQRVKVYHDLSRKKFRLCPVADDVILDFTTYGTLVFACDESDPSRRQGAMKPVASSSKSTSNDHESPEQHIPRPPNSWILFRQAKSKELSKEYPGSTASELSTIIAKMWREASQDVRDHWQARAKEEDRLHKEMYPGYKYTTKKSPKKENNIG